MKLPASLQSTLQTRWASVAPREKAMLAAAAGLIVLAVVWWLLLSPALTVLRAADTQHRALDAQLQSMRGMQAQAQALQSKPRIRYDEAVRALEASVKQGLAHAGDAGEKESRGSGTDHDGRRTCHRHHESRATRSTGVLARPGPG